MALRDTFYYCHDCDVYMSHGDHQEHSKSAHFIEPIVDSMVPKGCKIFHTKSGVLEWGPTKSSLEFTGMEWGYDFRPDQSYFYEEIPKSGIAEYDLPADEKEFRIIDHNGEHYDSFHVNRPGQVCHGCLEWRLKEKVKLRNVESAIVYGWKDIIKEFSYATS